MESKVIDRVKRKSGITRTRIKCNKAQGEKFNISRPEIMVLIKELEEEMKNEGRTFRICVTGSSPIINFTTLKGFEQSSDIIYDPAIHEDYMGGKYEQDNLEHFAQFTIVIDEYP